MSITIHLRGDPGHRTGTVKIGDSVHEYQWPIVSWLKKEGGEVEAYTSDGKMITLVLDTGSGGITIGAERWNLAGCVWRGAEMTGHATAPVSDAEMAAMFPDAGGDISSITA